MWASVANAATVTYSAPLQMTAAPSYSEPAANTPDFWKDVGTRDFYDTNFSERGILPQFNPALGTLTGVSVSLYVAGRGQGYVINRSRRVEDTVTYRAIINISAEIAGVDVSIPGWTVATDTVSLPIYDSANPYYHYWGPTQNETSTTAVVANFTPFIGAGTVAFNVNALGNSSAISGTGNTGIAFSTSAWAGARVTYTYAPFVRISGTVYHDKDANGTMGPADPRIGGVTITLACTNPTLNATTTTAADGSYSFGGIAAGSNCTVTETQPAGYINASTNPGTGGSSSADNVITFTSLQADSPNNNFGEVLPTDTTATLTCTPNPAAAGTPVTCTATCTNVGTNPALAATCQFTGTLPPNVTSNSCATPATSAVLAPGATLSCTLQFPAPATPLALSAGSGAGNDSNGGADPAAGNNPASAKLAPPATPVPTLGEWALVLMALLLGAVAAAPLRRSARG